MYSQTYTELNNNINENKDNIIEGEDFMLIRLNQTVCKVNNVDYLGDEGCTNDINNVLELQYIADYII